MRPTIFYERFIAEILFCDPKVADYINIKMVPMVEERVATRRVLASDYHSPIQSPAGLVLWRDGKLTLLSSGTQLLVFHRVAHMACSMHLHPDAWRGGDAAVGMLLMNMLHYGYLLPDLAPVMWSHEHYTTAGACFAWGPEWTSDWLDQMGNKEKHDFPPELAVGEYPADTQSS